jgi:hypothetical protein
MFRLDKFHLMLEVGMVHWCGNSQNVGPEHYRLVLDHKAMEGLYPASSQDGLLLPWHESRVFLFAIL